MTVRIEGERVIDAPRERVFEALTDPEVVAQTVPFVESFEVRDADHWDLVVKMPFPMAPTLALSFAVVEKRPPEHARLASSGGGPMAGADVESSFDLTDEGGRTRVRFVAELRFRGALAPMERLLEPVAQRQAERTLDAIERTSKAARAACAGR
jgi:carbon monoxide dehydrogenase subunit G